MNAGPNAEGARAPYVLIADDDAAIRTIMRTGLEAVGYEVATASDGVEALASLERRCPDVLVADLIMPRTHGDELARLCRERCPSAHLVFMSGYRSQQLRTLGITQVVFLEKPVSVHELRQTLNRLLGR